jgi:hypothetical protein
VTTLVEEKGGFATTFAYRGGCTATFIMIGCPNKDKSDRAVALFYLESLYGNSFFFVFNFLKN